MRKRFLILASVATMALAGTAMPAFADTGTTAATTTATVSVTCTFDPAVRIPGTTQVLDSYKVSVSQQVADYLRASTPHPVSYPALNISTVVTCR
jgi:hypothetical protein